MTRELILPIYVSSCQNDRNICFYTDLSVGRGINGVSYRTFDTQNYSIEFLENYIIFQTPKSSFYVEYSHIVSVLTYSGNYNYTTTGIK